MVDGRNSRVFPHVIAGVAQLRGFCELGLIAAGGLRTVEEQWRSACACADHGPAEAYLIVGQIRGFLVAIGIVVVGLHPGDQLIVVDAPVAQAHKIARIEILAPQCRTDGLAIVGGRGSAAAFAILGIQVGVRLVIQSGIALQHFAVLVLRAVLQNGGPILRTVEFVRQFDMLAGVETEAVNTVVHRGFQEVVHTIGDFRIGGVQIP